MSRRILYSIVTSAGLLLIMLAVYVKIQDYTPLSALENIWEFMVGREYNSILLTLTLLPVTLLSITVVFLLAASPTREKPENKLIIPSDGIAIETENIRIMAELATIFALPSVTSPGVQDQSASANASDDTPDTLLDTLSL